MQIKTFQGEDINIIEIHDKTSWGVAQLLKYPYHASTNEVFLQYIHLAADI